MRPFSRYVRIVWTTLFAVLSVLLLTLWVRSHWRGDDFEIRTSTQRFLLASADGEGELSIMHNRERERGWEYFCHQLDEQQREWHLGSVAHNSFYGFGYEYSDDSDIGVGHILIPIWFLFATALACTAVAWLPHWSMRYSLRTLLIAITLAAVALGLLICCVN